MSRRRKSTSKRRGQQAPKRGVELDQFYYKDLQVWQRRARDLERYSVELHFYLEGLRALHHDEIRSALASSKLIELINQEWVRIVDYRFSDQPLSAAGSLIQGGRFNIGNDLDPPSYQAFSALYLADNYDTAYAEKFLQSRIGKHALRGHELALRKPHSFTCVNVTGSIHCLYDLRSASN